MFEQTSLFDSLGILLLINYLNLYRFNLHLGVKATNKFLKTFSLRHRFRLKNECSGIRFLYKCAYIL